MGAQEKNPLDVLLLAWTHRVDMVLLLGGGPVPQEQAKQEAHKKKPRAAPMSKKVSAKLKAKYDDSYEEDLRTMRGMSLRQREVSRQRRQYQARPTWLLLQ
jgi:hypothetical protein